MTQYIKKLPAVFQTVTEKKFFDATFDQVFSKKDSDFLAGYLGRRVPGRYNPVSDFYLPEPSKNRTWWQLEPTAFAREPDSTKTNVFFYDDLLERIEYYGGNTLNQDRLFESEYYSFGPPIDYDMFINYQNYYWVEQGLSTIFISNVDITGYATLDDYINAEVIGKSTYTTQPTAIPPNLTFTTGLSVSFVDSVNYVEPRFVENFGGCIGIKLVERFSDFTSGTVFELLPWDGVIELANGRLISNLFWDATTWETQTQPTSGDYITIERGALDRNAWSRTNKWFHISAINTTLAITGDAFPSNATRALRPIIQFIADIPLFNSGTQFRDEIQYGFKDDALGNPITLSDVQGQPLATINAIYGIAMGAGDLVCFFNDPLSSGFIWIVNVDGVGIATFTEYTSVGTPVLEGDIVFITEDAPFNGAQRGATWYYSLGVWQQAFNDKVRLNQPPLFQLYDHNGVELNDAITYPESTFYGSEIFSYKVNDEPGATVDPVLRFPIVYTSLGQASDIVFQNDLIVERYTYGAARLDIDGYYYYKTTQEPILYNNWNLYQPCPCAENITDSNYETFTATALQTVFNTSLATIANSVNQTYLQVYVNGVFQREGIAAAYQVTGANQITFNTGLVLTDNVVIYSFAGLVIPPNYEELTSIAAQTIFNTTIPTQAAGGGNSYLQVYVNGVFQQEGVSSAYQVTGANQITFNTGLALSDNVVIVDYSQIDPAPNYSIATALAAQTVVNTTVVTIPATATESYLTVYVNGVFQQEGATKQYIVTGTNQITFNSGLLLNDNVVIYAAEGALANDCPNDSKQRVIDQYVVGYGTEFQFKLSVTPFGYVYGGGPVQPLADVIVSVNGAEIKEYDSITNPGGYTFVEINNRIYIVLTTYLTTLLTTVQAQPPVVEIQTYAIWVDSSNTTDYKNGLLDPAATGYYEIPQQLEANPNQLEIGEISASNLTEHFASIIAAQTGIIGISFGGDNNYRDTRKNRSLGEFILQNVAPLLKTMLVSSSNDLDFILGERFSQDEYTKFKNKYLQTALQLINTGFNPVQYYNNTIVVSAWVEEILKIVNISKEFSNAFAYSYIIANGSPFANESTVVPPGGLLTLTDFVDLADPKNAVYVYDVSGVEQLLTIGVDYEIVSTNLAIDVQFNTVNVPAGTPVFIALYKNPLPAYIPSTPTKVGAYQTYIPRIELDTTYVTPTYVIIGHDGSKTIAYGDYRDNLLLELEVRIYNLLQYKFRNQYYVPLRVESVKAGYFRQTRYLRSEFLDITDSYINKWSSKNRANYRTNDWATASLDPGVIPDPYTGNIWKLYNYRDAVDNLAQPLDLPGNWKGIFQYYYDTYYPDTRPWEMLGFGAQPNWWQFEYGVPVLNGAGQEVWTSTAVGNSNMWNDLEAGIIRQGPSAIYDPNTLVVQPQEMWARPGLSAIIPVDAFGEIVSVMTLFGVAYSGNPYAPFDTFEQDWIYGDGAPVEQAWMSTSAYAFMVQEFLYLMRPGPYGELMFDTVGTELSPGMIEIPTAGPNPTSVVMSSVNWQYVQNDTFTNSDPFFAWMRPKNKDQVVHAETVDGVVQVRYGYQRWISDRILFLGTNVGDVFGQKIRTLDVNLANKLAGFTNKDTTNTYIESITPGSTTSGLIIPSTNFEVFLHKSPPVDTYSYSGVVIRALADGTFAVYGYDLLNSEFLVLDRSNAKLIDVSIGGTPAPFLYFTPGATYNPGDYVRYNGVFYLSLVTQTVQKFEASGFQKLKALPTVGGVSVTYRPVSLTTITKVPYGSVLKTVQDVFDLLIGWGAYLESRGWKFTEVSQETNQISDWLYSAKQFLFWLNSEWAPDSSIQVSPAANKAILEVSRGYPEDVETISNGVYSILDKFGVAIAPTGTTTDRDGQLITVEPANLASGGIYFLQVNATETEHILIFDNTTNFNDVIYAPLLRARQQRLRFNGFRSNLWYGKMEAPGYLIIEDQLVPNYDTIVEAMRYFYDPNVTIDNPSLEDLGRHLIGYESKSYLDNLQVSDDVQYLFYRGAIRQKGTSQAFEKLFRSTKVQSDEIIEVYEEWALKLSDFGNVVEQVSTEFKLQPEQNTGEVIIARMNYVPSEIGGVKQISILNAENTYINVPAIFIPPPDATPPAWITFDPLVVYSIGTVVRYDDQQGNPVFYSSNIIQGPGPFIPANWTEVLRTRNARAFAVLDSIGRISRVDITDVGYGYLTAPLIGILSGAESNALDSLYSVWQGAIINDVSLDNVIDIDIDDTKKWTVRPNDPELSLEFPVTDKIEYPLPTAGYVNFNDVDLSSFDVTQTAVRWGSTGFNPIENNTVWVAKTFTEDWNVYKLIDVTTPSGFNVYANPAGELFLRTDPSYLITPQLTLGVNDTDFGNMIVLQVIEAQATAVIDEGESSSNATATATIIHAATATASAPTTPLPEFGQIEFITVVDGGAGYTFTPSVIISDPPAGVTATAVATVEDGVITEILITNSGSGYLVAPTVTIEDPFNVGEILELTIVNPGAGYVIAPLVSIIGDGAGSTATAQITDGQVTGFTITNPGSGYTVATVSIGLSPQSPGTITSITIDKTGAGYIIAPTITISGIGLGATATAEIAGGIVSAINIISGGSGYDNTTTITIDPPLSVSGENNFTVGFAFNQDETDIDPTYIYYNLLTLDANPITVDEVPDYANFTKLMLFKTMRFQTVTEALIPTYAILGDKVWVDNIDQLPSLWTVYTKITPTLQYPNGLEPFRQQEPLINSSLFENASVYGIKTATELVQLPVYDPFKNILPGPAKQNITYTSMQDPARYNITANLRLLSENITFGERQVGQLWWDLSFTRYVYYEQPIALDGSETQNDNLIYRRDRWGQIFPGSTVAIFEWVKSPVPPAEYTGTGTPRDTTSYVQLVTSNRFTDVTEVNFYFWVLNTTDRPNIENRTMAAVNVSRLLQSPRSQGFAFFAPIQQTSTNNSYMFYNVQEILAYQGDNVQVQYKLTERDDQEHAQWSFFREGDPNSIVTDQFWNKMVDSLCGYTKVLPLSDEFSNEIILYNDIPWDIFSWDTVVWDAEAYGIILPVPDPSLTESEKYGIEYRPRQSMFVKLQSARKVFVQAANDLLMHIAIRDDNPAWNINVATDVYWEYTNWYAVGFENAIPTVVFQTLLQANTALTAGQLVVRDIVQVTNGTIDGRFVLYNVVQLNPNVPVLSLEEIGIEKSAIKLLDTVYTTSNVYGLSVELRELLNAFRTEVMVDEFIVDQNEVYFSMMNYVLSEQKNPDWVFKTSYIYIKENNQPLTQDLLYTPDQIDDVIDFIVDSKPYHTKIRDYTTTYVTSDIAAGTASDSYKINTILAFGPDNTNDLNPGHWDASCESVAISGDEWGDENWGDLAWEDPTLLSITTLPWDSYAWDVCPPETYIVNARTFIDDINQFISREDVYTVPLTFYDVSKVGYSQLFPYTFDFTSINLNDPQSFVAPEDIVGIQVGTTILIYGQHYFVEYNNSSETYTVYFYNDPTAYLPEVPVALVWYDGGSMQHFRFNTVRNEIAYGFANDDLVVNVDTTLAINDMEIGPYAYTAFGDVWDLVDPVIDAIIQALPGGAPMGFGNSPWDQSELIVPGEYSTFYPGNTISSKENTNINDNSNFYRNADAYAGVLVSTLLAPTEATYNVQSITVSAPYDIFPDPAPFAPGVIWIEGERIEYRLKTFVAVNTWELGLVRRGTMGTAATQHDALVPEVDPTLVGPDGETILKNPIVLTPNKVWVERGNYMPVNSNINAWSAINSTGDPATEVVPNEFTSVTSVPLGGLWYAQTPEATFLKQEQGTSIP